MDEIWTLILLSVAMLIGCYLSGLIPLAFTFSEEKLKLVTVFGAGLLVGAALAVIIPEGIHAMYSDELGNNHEHGHSHEGVKEEPGKHSETEATHEHHHDHGMADTHSVIGVTLVAGFIFMLLVDQIGGSHMHGPRDTESGDTIVQQNRHKITATLGLVVHAAADGIALGAAVMLNHSSLTILVFVAIMLHKAPAAFGLVSFLLHEGFDRPRIKKHLFVFSVAAPIGAVATYILLSQRSAESFTDIKTTGIAMLFSAGTFLYVATVHVLPEVSSGQVRHTNPDGTVVVHEHKGFKSAELVAIVVGAILPVLLSLGHKH